MLNKRALTVPLPSSVITLWTAALQYVAASGSAPLSNYERAAVTQVVWDHNQDNEIIYNSYKNALFLCNLGCGTQLESSHKPSGVSYDTRAQWLTDDRSCPVPQLVKVGTVLTRSTVSTVQALTLW